ncbi:hypothetical protein JX265_008936 [Neoarthrinium moseri]|uniref:RING-type domain-containing protein n=1 Tax=Neoarthrinium moseri TaxID=1658444 RepID=A0A9P9WGY6_9PEZI|nr:hypothetical protein JX265_008936 [Neoarthrinium moseri]
MISPAQAHPAAWSGQFGWLLVCQPPTPASVWRAAPDDTTTDSLHLDRPTLWPSAAAPSIPYSGVSSRSSIYLEIPGKERHPTSPQHLPPTSSDNRNDSSSDDDNTRRCFICLVDEPAESLPADWATPCTCTLEGHQSCLLTWVADLEMQGKAVTCPLCKSSIGVVDRWDPAVQLSDAVTNQLSGLSPWVLLTFGLSGAAMGSAFYGVHALDVFAGPEAVQRFLYLRPESEGYLDMFLAKMKATAPSLVPWDVSTVKQMLARNDGPVDVNAPIDVIHFLSLTLVAPALILNRMSLSETVMIPSSLTYAMFFSDHRADMFDWPPSPQKVLAAFPVVKAVYFQLYRAAARRLDKKLAAVATQPRNLQGETPEQAALRQEAAGEPQPDAAADHIIDIQLDFNIRDDDDDAIPGDRPQNDAAPVRPNRAAGGFGSLFNYIAGALMWPTVSYGAGSVLRWALPASWVNRPASGPVTGLLQERWGRSLVGGCLFVVLKDAFFLYVKWRKTINRPYRRIRNVDRRPRQG